MQENKTGKTKENSEKKNHQGRETREVETKVPHPLHNTITLILTTTDQNRVVEGKVEAVTQVGGQTEGTLSTQKSR